MRTEGGGTHGVGKAFQDLFVRGKKILPGARTRLDKRINRLSTKAMTASSGEHAVVKRTIAQGTSKNLVSGLKEVGNTLPKLLSKKIVAREAVQSLHGKKRGIRQESHEVHRAIQRFKDKLHSGTVGEKHQDHQNLKAVRTEQHGEDLEHSEIRQDQHSELLDHLGIREDQLSELLSHLDIREDQLSDLLEHLDMRAEQLIDHITHLGSRDERKEKIAEKIEKKFERLLEVMDRNESREVRAREVADRNELREVRALEVADRNELREVRMLEVMARMSERAVEALENAAKDHRNDIRMLEVIDRMEEKFVETIEGNLAKSAIIEDEELSELLHTVMSYVEKGDGTIEGISAAVGQVLQVVSGGLDRRGDPNEDSGGNLK